MIIIDKKYNWKKVIKRDFECWYIGYGNAIELIINTIIDYYNSEYNNIKKYISGINGNFGIIVETENRIIAAVDKIRSFPIFYSHEKESINVSNSSRILRCLQEGDEIDDMALLEFRMAGYVTGRNTILKNTSQLQAGEILFWNKSKSQIQIERYFNYFPDIHNCQGDKKYHEYIDELETQTGKIFDGLIENAAGRPIWVPLSGGLDSRLVLCMLAGKGYDNLHAFSYGVPGNHEARIAQTVALKIGVPWRFIPIGREAFRRFYGSRERREYWSFCDFMCSVPNMQDLLPLKEMLERGTMSRDAVLVNGQSGDFITGGHIPETLAEDEADWDNMVDALISKHFSQWTDRLNAGNLSRVIEKFVSDLGETFGEPKAVHSKAALYEYWEWQERQCKYVVNGQRVYDWLGLDWALPLWESAYLDFWRNVPVRIKAGQRLYLDYLKRWNACGLFNGFDPTVWRWPGPMIAVVPLARAAGLIFGARAKDALYRIAAYRGHYGYYFAAIGLLRYLRQMGQARGAMAFFIDDWLRENVPCEQM